MKRKEEGTFQLILLPNPSFPALTAALCKGISSEIIMAATWMALPGKNMGKTHLGTEMLAPRAEQCTATYTSFPKKGNGFKQTARENQEKQLLSEFNSQLSAKKS